MELSTSINNCEFSVDEIVFAKIKGFPWWPAIVIILNINNI